MKRIVTIIAAVGVLASCRQIEMKTKASTPVRTNTVQATISVKQTQFDLAAGDEVDVSFAISNATARPVPGPEFCNMTKLFINGDLLTDSSFIFNNGLAPVEEDHMFPPGGSHLFLYRLTRYFNKRGIYHVMWRGEHFETEALVFRVVSTRKE